MSTAIASPDAPPADREIVCSRLLNFPREVVFRAFTDPDCLARWWGPSGFTNTFKEFDLKPSGMWRFTMHGPDGVDYHNVSEFVEIVTPERIVFEHLESHHHFQMTMLYDDEAGKTRLTWRMLFDSQAEVEQIGKFIAEANSQNFDRLEAQLREQN